MRIILDRAIALLRAAGIREVYSSFDAVPLPNKSGKCFTVVGLESVQMDAPFPDGGGGVYPFAATLKISVLVPMTSPAARAEEFYFNVLLPVLHQLGAMPGETTPPMVDIKLQKMVMSGLLCIRGLYTEWDASEELPEELI